MEIVIVYLVFCFIVAAAASSRGRSGIGWFFLSLVISPLLSLILVLVLPRSTAAAIAQRTTESEPQKRCPYCAEIVNARAIKCRHCGSDLTGNVTPDTGRQV